MRSSVVLLALAVLPGLALVGEKDASACGGCFGPPTETDDTVTAHRMVLSVSPQQTTLYDEIQYSGSPSSFAWVLPITGQVTIGISSDAIFDTLDQNSTTTVSPPPVSCQPPPSDCAQAPSENAGAAGSGSSSGGSVTVTSSQTVGPYQTVQLQSTDANALDNWLTTNGYAITPDIEPVIAAYVAAGFDFLAMKLVPGAGVQSMRPVRVTFAGASPTLPLRMVAAGTGAITGITLWVVADGRWEPANFPWFHVDDSQLVWDWSTSESNYTTLRQQQETASNNTTWEVESSLAMDVATVQQQVSSLVTASDYGATGSSSGGGTSGADGYDPIAATSTTPGETADQVMQDDLTALLSGISGSSFRLTRLRTDLAHAALANDLQLQAASDQSVLSNQHTATQSVNGPFCPVYDGCNQVGSALVVEGQAQSGGAGCSTAASAVSSLGWVETTSLAGLVGLLGLVSVRARRRRG
jgi:Uncharacterized protein conserved in bacteria (DUF2330)